MRGGFFLNGTKESIYLGAIRRVVIDGRMNIDPGRS
jgi:hypothetical protein